MTAQIGGATFHPTQRRHCGHSCSLQFRRAPPGMCRNYQTVVRGLRHSAYRDPRASTCGSGSGGLPCADTNALCIGHSLLFKRSVVPWTRGLMNILIMNSPSDSSDRRRYVSPDATTSWWSSALASISKGIVWSVSHLPGCSQVTVKAYMRGSSCMNPCKWRASLCVHQSIIHWAPPLGQARCCHICTQSQKRYFSHNMTTS